jgi:hypothetical protein
MSESESSGSSFRVSIYAARIPLCSGSVTEAGSATTGRSSASCLMHHTKLPGKQQPSLARQQNLQHRHLAGSGGTPDALVLAPSWLTDAAAPLQTATRLPSDREQQARAQQGM